MSKKHTDVTQERPPMADNTISEVLELTLSRDTVLRILEQHINKTTFRGITLETITPHGLGFKVTAALPGDKTAKKRPSVRPHPKRGLAPELYNLDDRRADHVDERKKPNGSGQEASESET